MFVLFRRAKLSTLIALFILTIAGAAPLRGPAASAASNWPHALTSSPQRNVFVPTVMGPYTPRAPIFGVQIDVGRVAATIQKSADVNAAWIRYNAITWAAVESTPGQRNWAALQPIEAEMAVLSSRGAHPIITISGTPTWARLDPTSTCGPIAPTAQPAFAQFMRDLVQRYSGPPYNVHYWEIWNEPDGPVVSGNPPYGCWGDPSDAYYGGGRYGDMLKLVYPAVKSADPAAQVVLGGLLLDCDPANPLPGTTCAAGNFLEGMLRNGAGAAFDLVAYHAYIFWGTARTDWDLATPKWQVRGGALLGKLSFLRSVLGQYGLSNKPIIMDEGSFLCYSGTPSCGSSDFYPDQANYLVRFYARAASHGLAGAAWYALDEPGWRDAGLLDPSGQPHPAYNTLKFFSTLLQGANFSSSLSSGNVEGYEFKKGKTTYRVYWTNDNSSAPLLLPSNTQLVYNKFGQAVTTQATMTIGFDPIIVQLQGP